MAVRVADSIKQMNDNNEFPVAYGADIWLDKNKGQGNPDYKSIQGMLNDDELGGGGEQIQYEIMPAASATNLGRVVQYVGVSGTYQNGFFYRCVSDEEPTPTYSWEVVELAAEVPVATEQKPGIVKPDGETITVDSDGTIHAAPANTFNAEDFSVDSQNEVSLLPVRRVFNGTRADWDLLSVEEKTQYGATAFTDDGGVSGDVETISLTQNTSSAYNIIELKAIRMGNIVNVVGIVEVIAQIESLTIATGFPPPLIVQDTVNSTQIYLSGQRGTNNDGQSAKITKDGELIVYTSTSGGNYYFSGSYIA